MGVLKMRRSSEDSNGSKGVKEGSSGNNGVGAVVKKSSGERVKQRNGQEGEVDAMETESGSGTVQETLVDKFKKGRVKVKVMILYYDSTCMVILKPLTFHSGGI